MNEKPKTEADRKMEEWMDTPAVNPHYRGATPRQVARALLGRSVTPTRKIRRKDAAV